MWESTDGAEGVVPLDWTADRRNSVCEISPLRAISTHLLSPVIVDLLDIATAVYLADVATVRGSHEEWVRDIRISVPVREPDLWHASRQDLCHLLYVLTRDRIELDLPQGRPAPPCPPQEPTTPPDVDCVCLLSGGLDSLAGAVMLLRTGRRPLFVSHQSGNPTVEAVQRRILAILSNHWPGQFTAVGIRVSPSQHSSQALPFPAPQLREKSRRARSFLFTTLGAVAAQAVGVSEVYLCENGILTAALPLTPARVGSLSTRSTHPMALSIFGDILERAGIPCTVENPFIQQTKGEVLRTCLKPSLTPQEIGASVSCWAAGRHNRPCGGCVPCILRRLSLLSAGLPDEACMVDVLATPEQYRGTEAYGNLIDLLTQAATFMTKTELDLLLEYPQLVDLHTAGTNVEDTVRTLKRHAAEVYAVCEEHFPASAALMSMDL